LPDLKIVLIRIHNVNAANMNYDGTVRTSQDSFGLLTNFTIHTVDDLEVNQLHMNSNSYHTIGNRIAPLFPY
jgi:hypothetical protein